MKSCKFIGLIEDIHNPINSSYDEGNIAVDKTGKLHCFTDGRFVEICFGPRPDLAIDYLYNHKEEFKSFKNIFDFVYSYSVGEHPDQVRDMMRSMETFCD